MHCGGHRRSRLRHDQRPPRPPRPPTSLALFEKPHWDDYTQVWILSGSELDAADVELTGARFDMFLTETQGSCIPLLLGAGDGFITHGNAIAAELGIGEAAPPSSTSNCPGFFKVSGPISAINVETRMFAGKELSPHALFENVSSIADVMSTYGEGTHGDSVAEVGTTYQVVAHDTGGRPSIAVGSVALPTGDRPFSHRRRLPGASTP